MRVRVYLDEDVPLSFAQALINRGVDVLTTHQAGNAGLSDNAQLAFAASAGRTFFTHNKKDFILLHNGYMETAKGHAGIIVADQLPVGMLLRRFMKLWFSLNPSDLEDRLEFLSNWK